MASVKKWHQNVTWTALAGCGKAVKAAIVNITPAIASEMLAGASNYRDKDKHRVDKYSQQMVDGNWEFNCDTIKCDAGFNNVDGQHRLDACIKSGVAFVTLVVVGVESVAETDRGKGRTVVDALRFSGETCNRGLAAIIGWAWCYQKFGMRNSSATEYRPSCTESLAFLNANPSIREFAKIAARLSKIKRSFYTAVGGLLFCACEQSGQSVEKAAEFIDGVVKGVEWDFVDARHQLHVRLMNNASSKTHLDKKDVLAMCIKAWNRWLLKMSSSPASIRWTGAGDTPQEFPQIITAAELAEESK